MSESYNNASWQNYRNADAGRQAPPPPPPQAPQPPKKRGGASKIVALALVCALVGGGVGSLITNTAVSDRQTTLTQSDRDRTEVQLISAQPGKERTPAEIYASYVNSTVGIKTETTSYNIFGQITQNAASGSGFIISEDGYIVTNHHVISGATAITITLYGGAEYPAQLVGSDEDNDLAVLKIQADGLTPVVLGRSSAMNVGETVTIIGNPLGELTFSLSSGHVSALDRSITLSNSPFVMMQFDAAVNPGNSGGPVFNAYGEVVGIVTAKYSQDTVEGLGFAIPMDQVLDMITDLMEQGYVTGKAHFGFVGDNISQATAAQYGLTPGVYVYSLTEGGPAELAGLQAGDIITAVDGKSIGTLTDLEAVKKAHRAGDQVTLTVSRGGETLDLTLTFGEAPRQEVQQPQQPQQQIPQQGYGSWGLWDSFFGGSYPNSGYAS